MKCEGTETVIVESYSWANRVARFCAFGLSGSIEAEDLQSAGIVGYVTAARHYDPSKGGSFRAFCATRIRGAILDEMRSFAWTPRSVFQKRKAVESTRARLSLQLEREPTHAELAQSLGVAEEEFSRWRVDTEDRQMVSIDGTSGREDEESHPLAEMISDHAAVRPDFATLSSEARAQLYQCIRHLPKTEAKVIILHYIADVPFKEIAQQVGLQPSRVSQLHHQALARLRRWMKESSEKETPITWAA